MTVILYSEGVPNDLLKEDISKPIVTVMEDGLFELLEYLNELLGDSEKLYVAVPYEL